MSLFYTCNLVVEQSVVIVFCNDHMPKVNNVFLKLTTLSKCSLCSFIGRVGECAGKMDHFVQYNIDLNSKVSWELFARTYIHHNMYLTQIVVYYVYMYFHELELSLCLLFA